MAVSGYSGELATTEQRSSGGRALSKSMVVSQGDVKCSWWCGWWSMVVAMNMDGLVVEKRESNRIKEKEAECEK